MSIRRQGVLFVLVGGAQLLIDWVLFVVATWLGMTVVPANLIARLTAAAAGFWLNGRLTFADHRGSRLGGWRFRRFLVVWAALTLVSTLAMRYLAGTMGLESAWLAKPVVEAVLAGVSFLLQRHWVYGDRSRCQAK